MRRNQILGLAAQAVAGGVAGITFAIVGGVIGVLIVPETGDPGDPWGVFLFALFYGIFGGLIGYTQGTVSGVYFSGKWLRRERSFWVLILWCVFGVGFAVFLIQRLLWDTYRLKDTPQSLLVFIPAVVLTLVSHLFGHLKRGFKQHYHKGRAYAKQARWNDAAREYRAALRIKPEDMKARLALGVACRKQGRFAEAVQEYQAVLKMRPDSPRIHNNLALAYYQQGRVGDAIQAAERALKLGLDEARHLLGVIQDQTPPSPTQRPARISPSYAVDAFPTTRP